MKHQQGTAVWSYIGLSSIAVVVMLAMSWNGIYYRLASPPLDIRFTGSDSCANCHADEHLAWQDSLHKKMMQRVSTRGAQLADFAHPDTPANMFAEDVRWTIGSKWQQQFMGHDGSGETLLPGAWNVAHETWKRQSWDGWAEPVPLQRCHGCHTVGLNPETGHFVEPGIGCESCHGAGGWHVQSRGIAGIHTGLEAGQCGQCHARGRSPDGALFYPANFIPGNELESHFTEWEPDYIQNSSAWWGNGRERKRHQQFTAWKVGGHVNALNNILDGYDGQYGEVSSDCMTCHAAEAALAPLGVEVKVSDMQNGITCSVCHTTHGTLDTLRMQCDACHDQGVYHHQDEALVQHVPCPPEASVQCADCHMPKTAKIAGQYQLHSHHPGIVPPTDTEQFGVNRHQFTRHLLAINNGMKRGVYEQQALQRGI